MTTEAWAPLASVQVLLVEDEQDARESLTRLLRGHGLGVTAAANVSGARAHLASGPAVDVVVTDMVLENEHQGGLQVLEASRAVSGAPVVVITAFADLQNVKGALNGGAAYLLEKPFSVAQLRDVLVHVLKRTLDVNAVAEKSLSEVGLTRKELAVARLVLKGLTSAEIARVEDNSEKTIKQHITEVYAKCGVRSRAEFFHFVFPS